MPCADSEYAPPDDATVPPSPHAIVIVLLMDGRAQRGAVVIADAPERRVCGGRPRDPAAPGRRALLRATLWERIGPCGQDQTSYTLSKHGRLGSCVETGPTAVLDVLDVRSTGRRAVLAAVSCEHA